MNLSALDRNIPLAARSLLTTAHVLPKGCRFFVGKRAGLEHPGNGTGSGRLGRAVVRTNCIQQGLSGGLRLFW